MSEIIKKINRREAVKMIGFGIFGAVIQSRIPPFAITLPLGREGKSFFYHTAHMHDVQNHEYHHRQQIRERTEKLGTIRGDLQFAIDYIKDPCRIETEAGNLLGKRHFICSLQDSIRR